MIRPIRLSLFFAFLVALIAAGCATRPANPNLPNLISESEYYRTVDEFTDRKQVYDGFYATMEVSATLMNTKVSRNQIDQNARIYQWDETKYLNEKSKTESNLAKQTEVFLSFFVPERKHDDLSKTKTTWKVFLDAGGKRYEGKAEKMKSLFAEVQTLYPRHSRWSTPYKVIFPVPITFIENADSKMTLTGPVGSTSVSFKSVSTEAPPVENTGN